MIRNIKAKKGKTPTHLTKAGKSAWFKGDQSARQLLKSPR
jgi:hypothetical protein